METLPALGTCRCGATRIEVSVPPIMTAACHCSGCRKMASSAFSLTMMVPVAGFRVVEGAPVLGGIKGPQLDHYCCPDCLSWMFTRIAGIDAFLNVRPVMFDVPEWSEPFIETMCAERLDWATTPARHSYDGFPGEADFPALLAEYAEHAAH
ncbi:GFA family protein [Salipiger sp.]|uniref:GFA family protein n=1 Tax=Salipiger sp. TaxID=2078585 RepID=UPI003A97246D